MLTVTRRRYVNCNEKKDMLTVTRRRYVNCNEKKIC